MLDTPTRTNATGLHYLEYYPQHNVYHYCYLSVE